MHFPAKYRKMNLNISRTLLSTFFLCAATMAQADDINWHDPFDVDHLTQPTPLGHLKSVVIEPCAQAGVASPLGLGDIVDRTLCQNPQSAAAWSNARYEAALVGVAQSAYLPNVNVNGEIARNAYFGASPFSDYNSLTTNISLSYLLYDFGGRDASLENAQRLFAAASATQDSVVQNLFLQAIQGFYQVNASQAALESTREAERAAKASLDAATGRYKAGVATPADRLQAQTAWSQSVLNRIRAEGDLKNARGVLANLMGLDADSNFELKPSPATPEYEKFESNVSELIAEARRRRPDLAAAEAQVKAAEAGISLAEANGKPTVSLTTNLGYLDRQFADSTRSGAIGVNVTIPLFTGFSSTYKIRAAQQQVEARQANRDQINLQIALDVWKAYQSVQTETQAVQSSGDLVSSATQNADVALGRYKAGVGNIIDLITAQSSLASARAQQIQETFNWNIARAGLAYAMGQLDDRNVIASDNVK